MQMDDEPGLALALLYSNVCLQQGERTWDYRHEQGIAMIHFIRTCNQPFSAPNGTKSRQMQFSFELDDSTVMRVKSYRQPPVHPWSQLVAWLSKRASQGRESHLVGP
jgi:hypothetical protein